MTHVISDLKTKNHKRLKMNKKKSKKKLNKENTTNIIYYFKMSYSTSFYLK